MKLEDLMATTVIRARYGFLTHLAYNLLGLIGSLIFVQHKGDFSVPTSSGLLDFS